MGKTGRAEEVLGGILDRLGEGTRLPPERVLCSELEISRGTLRRALERLEARGRIWRHVGRGTFVGARPVKPDGGISLLSAATSPDELMEMRLIFEPQIARLAATRATRQEIARMEECVKKTGAVSESEAYELWDAKLHRSIAEAAHNKLLLAIFDAMNEVRRMTEWGRLRDRAIRSRKVQLSWWAQHARFVAAIAERDGPRAEHEARQHVESVRMQVLSSSAPGKAPSVPPP